MELLLMVGGISVIILLAKIVFALERIGDNLDQSARLNKVEQEFRQREEGDEWKDGIQE